MNLASREYALCVEKYLEKEMRYVTCVFGEEQGKTDAGHQACALDEAQRTSSPVIQKGTHAKMARGEMVRFAAEHRISAPEGLKDFNRLGYEYREEYSERDLYVFCRSVPSDRD